MRAMRRQQYKKFCSFVAHQFCISIIFQNVWGILDFNVQRNVHLDFTDLDVDWTVVVSPVIISMVLVVSKIVET